MNNTIYTQVRTLDFTWITKISKFKKYQQKNATTTESLTKPIGNKKERTNLSLMCCVC